MPEIDRNNWDEIVSNLPGKHILQTQEWGDAKRTNEWHPLHQVWHDSEGEVVAATLILVRGVSISGVNFPFRAMYIPRGPLLRDWYDPELRHRVLADLQSLGKLHKAIFIKMDPEVEYGRGVPGEAGHSINPSTPALISDLEKAGWISSIDQVQFKNTMTIDLRPSPEELLARMKQKTRYNIRLASRKGVSVRPGAVSDFKSLYKMYAETSLRDGFTIRNENYYLSLWQKFIESGMAEALLAEVGGEPVAGVVIFRFAGRAWFMFGMSRETHREKMPNYLLQWEAMIRAKEAGCVEYDLWGAPDEFTESDELWGVYRFKRGLGGEVVRYIGAWELPLNNLAYRSYTQFMPRLLSLMRWRGREQTEGSIQAG
jgi:lipid II:glycine glycyltransferase (peptidoglycan interpeptide bridge formation enzyme)